MSDTLYLFTDDSGTSKFGNGDDAIFSLCSVLIEEEALIKSDELFTDFKNQFSSKLGFQIDYLHNIEIEDGLLRGEGRYHQLKSDQELANDFLQSATELLKTIDYRLLSVVFDPKEYLDWLEKEIHRYYGDLAVESDIQTSAIFPTTFFFQLKYLYQDKAREAHDHFFFFVEERSDTTNQTYSFLNAGISVLFREKHAQLYLGIKKGSDDYRSAMEIADLSANVLRKHLIDPKLRQREYELYRDKILLNKRLSKDDFIKAFGELKTAQQKR